MSKYPGENLLVTLFGDVHYYITPPSTRPPHDRFDKGSYVYIYRSTSTGRGRLEIANNPSLPEVDSFYGFLDKTHTQWTHKQPCLVTVTVTDPPGPPTPSDDQEWRLPTPDPNNNGRYMYKLHTIEIYFWTPEDAQNFINQLKAIVSPQALQLIGAPPPAPAAATRLSFPAPPGASTPLQNTDSLYSVTPQSSAGGLPPPPPPLGGAAAGSPLPPSSGGPIAGPIGGAASKKNDAPADYTPLAYNPAAPPKPEAIAIRTKTPPPVDGDTGLAAAASADHYPGRPPVGLSQYGAPGSQAGGYAPQSGGLGPQPGGFKPQVGGFGPQAGGLGPSAGGPMFSGPPKPVTSPAPGLPYGQTPPPPPGSVGSHGSPYGPPAPGQAAAPNTFGQPSYAPSQPQYGGYPQSTQSPPAPGFGNYIPPPPAGGQAQGQQPNPYDVHNQSYQPGPGESSTSQAASKPSGKQNELQRLEAGIGKFFKKVEKKIG